MVNILEASVYVGTYAKYNNGSIFGKWLYLADYSSMEKFYDECRKLHKDEEDPEFMFQDYENIPRCLCGECSLSKNFFEIINVVREMGENEASAFVAWIDERGENLDDCDIQKLKGKFEDCYMGSYDSEEDFAYQLVQDCYNLQGIAKDYFDYEKFARDLFYMDYTFIDTHVFQDR